MAGTCKTCKTTRKTADAVDTGLIKSDTLKQWNYSDVIGIKKNGRIVPIVFPIKLGNRTHNVILHMTNDTAVDCFVYDECERCSTTTTEFCATVDYFQDQTCTYEDNCGYIHHPTWTEHIHHDGVPVDPFGNALALTTTNTWYVGKDMWRGNDEISDEFDYGYPEEKPYVRPRRGKDGTRTHGFRCACKECQERRI